MIPLIHTCTDTDTGTGTDTYLHTYVQRTDRQTEIRIVCISVPRKYKILDMGRDGTGRRCADMGRELWGSDSSDSDSDSDRGTGWFSS